MNPATWIVLQLLSYSIPTWVLFIVVPYCAARYGGLPMVPIGHLVITALIVFLDVRWIQSEMHKPGWNGTPDMDFIFYIGVALRILLINAVLLPMTGFGLWRRHRSHTPGPGVPGVQER